MTRQELVETLVEEFIHVVGFSGSGKTTIMKQLKRKYPKLSVYDSDDWQAKRFKEVSSGSSFPNTDDKQLKVDRLVAGDIAQFASKFAGRKRRHGLVVGIHPFVGNRAKWQRYQLATGSTRSIYRQLKRDKEKLGLKDRAMAYTKETRHNRWAKQEYRALGYKPISVRNLKKRVAQLSEGARGKYGLRTGVHAGLAVGHGVLARRAKNELWKSLNVAGAGAHGLYTAANLGRVLQRDPEQSPYVVSKRKGQKGTRVNKRKKFKGYLWNKQEK